MTFDHGNPRASCHDCSGWIFKSLHRGHLGALLGVGLRRLAEHTTSVKLPDSSRVLPRSKAIVNICWASALEALQGNIRLS